MSAIEEKDKEKMEEEKKPEQEEQIGIEDDDDFEEFEEGLFICFRCFLIAFYEMFICLFCEKQNGTRSMKMKILRTSGKTIG